MVLNGTTWRKKEMFISYGLDLVKLEEWKNKQIESINKKYRDKEESDRLKVIETEKAESKKDMTLR